MNLRTSPLLKLVQHLVIVIVCAMTLSYESICQSNRGFGLSGAITIGGDAYHISGFENRRSPYAYFASGRMSLNYKSFSVPVQLNYSNQEFSYGYSLNRIGITPTYKWAKLHLGWSSMEFSPLVMNRKQFLGAGFELRPGNLYAAGFVGRFENPAAVRDTILYGAILIPSFQRNAVGVSLGFGKTRNKIKLSILSVKDDTLSRQSTPSEVFNILPQDNLVIGLGFKLSPFKNFSIESDLAGSVLTSNKNSEVIEIQEAKFLQKLITPTISTKASGSGEVRFRYSLRNTSFGVEYRRIEPSFRSFGLPFMQNDIQSILGFTSLSLFKSKLLLNAQVGNQTNNLRNNRTFETSRLVTNLNLQLKLSDQLSTNILWTNFINDSEPGAIELSDTLRFTMVSNNMGIIISYRKKEKENRWNFTLGVNRQTLQDLSPINRLSNDVENFQVNVSCSKNFDNKGLQIKSSLLFSKFDGSFRNQKRYGGSIGVVKSISKDKMNVSINSRYFINDVDEFSNGYVINQNGSFSFNVTKMQSVNLRVNHIVKSSQISNNFSELRAGIAYSIRM